MVYITLLGLNYIINILKYKIFSCQTVRHCATNNLCISSHRTPLSETYRQQWTKIHHPKLSPSSHFNHFQTMIPLDFFIFQCGAADVIPSDSVGSPLYVSALKTWTSSSCVSPTNSNLIFPILSSASTVRPLSSSSSLKGKKHQIND